MKLKDKPKKLKGQVNSCHVQCATDDDDVGKFEKLIKHAKGVKPPQAPPPTIQMGGGKAFEPTTVFARKFRWTLEGNGLPQHFTKSVKFDYKNKTIKVEYYNAATPEDAFHALLWINKVVEHNPSEELKFVTYDGCGNPLYEMVFKGLELVEHGNDFDYASSDVACEVFTVKYSTVEKRVILRWQAVKGTK